jgi:hypothetical protein
MHKLRCEDDKLRFVLDLREARRAYLQKGLGDKRKTIKRKDAFLEVLSVEILHIPTAN